jgi:hypothetical protein
MTQTEHILMLLDNALAILDLATQEMADPKHPLHRKKIELEVYEGRKRVVKGAELLRLRVGK